ncbi:hypothetical protein BDB01DRAFT_789506 [Pilobolus umbonatus]|nr:hypothetical protein BDB01DRAFT_789506 [Pilobolus umbonatus]
MTTHSFVIELVFDYIHPEDYFACLTVNKHWHSLFHKILYKSIVSINDQRLEMLLDALTLYSRNKGMAEYTEHLDISNIKSADRFGFNTYNEDNIIKALTHCPNLLELKVKNLPDIIFTLLDPRTPQLNKLRKFNLNPPRRGYGLQREIMAVYYKFRARLPLLDFSNLQEGVYTYSADALVTYLTSFPCLENLRIDVNYEHLRDHISFQDIISPLHTITDVKYECHSLNIPAKEQPSIMRKPSMKILALNMDHLYLQDKQYIKNTFTGLTSLVLTVDQSVTDHIYVIDDFMGMETLNNLTLILPGSFDKNTVHAFWKYAHPMSRELKTPPKHKAIIYYHGDSPMNEYSFKRCPDSGIRTLTSNSWRTSQSILSYKNHLESIRDCLHEFVLQSWADGFDSNLGVINQLHPTLPNLTLITSFISLHPVVPNYKMNILSLERTNLTDLSFRMIETAFPMLQELAFSYVHIMLDNSRNDICHIQLPETGLKSVTLDAQYYSNTEYIMVLKEVDGILIRSWHWDSKKRKIEMTEYESIQPVIDRLSEGTLYLLKSTSVEKVQTCHY